MQRRAAATTAASGSISATSPPPSRPPRWASPSRRCGCGFTRSPPRTCGQLTPGTRSPTLTKKIEPDEILKVETSYRGRPPRRAADAFFLVWSGSFVQERDGALRFGVSGKTTAIMVDGRLELPVGEGGRTVDVFARRGLHGLTIISIGRTGHRNGRRPPRPREPAVFRGLDATFHDRRFRSRRRPPTYPRPQRTPAAEFTQDANRWTLDLPSRELRFIDFEFLEYRGEAIAVSHVDRQWRRQAAPPAAEDVLELATQRHPRARAGRHRQVSYLDEITAGGQQRNRLLTRDLTATYYNGVITPISYDFERAGGGAVQGARKELHAHRTRRAHRRRGGRLRPRYRPRPGQRGGRGPGERRPPLTLTATETGPSTGIFTVEIDTAAEPADGKIVVKQGDKVYLRYLDKQNIFPGHAFHRETIVYLNQPSAGVIQIVESETPVERYPAADPGGRDRGHRTMSARSNTACRSPSRSSIPTRPRTRAAPSRSR